MDKHNFAVSTHFKNISDPRKYNIRHKLIDIITIAICALVCGAQNWMDVEQYGKSKQDWLKEFLELPNGIPSHDTFGRVFSMLDPKHFTDAFITWSQSIQAIIGQIAIDGKTLRTSYDNAMGKGAIHMVSAWVVDNGIILGQVKTGEKSNEITAIPELLKQIELEGVIVSIDAMGTQTAIAGQIIGQKGDYVLALKGNQSSLHDQVRMFFEDKEQTSSGLDRFETVDGDHGRIETRRYATCSDIDWLQGRENWAGLKTITQVQRERHVDDNVSIETSYYISSLGRDIQKMARAIRGHWQIENSLHWVLDMTFDEDRCRVRKDNAPANMAILRHIVLNMIRQEKSFKGSVQRKRLKAGWENNYLLKIINS